MYCLIIFYLLFVFGYIFCDMKNEIYVRRLNWKVKPMHAYILYMVKWDIIVSFNYIYSHRKKLLVKNISKIYEISIYGLTICMFKVQSKIR